MYIGAPLRSATGALTQRAIAPVLKYATNVSSRTLELFMLVNSFRRAAQPTVLFFLPSFDAACHSTLWYTL